MAVGEGADAHILANEAHLVAFRNQRGIGHRLGEAPVGEHGAGGHAAAVLDDLLHLAVQHETLRQAVQAAGEVAQRFEAHAGVGGGLAVGIEIGRPVHEQRPVRFLHQRQRREVGGVECIAVQLHLGIHLGIREGARRHHPIGVDAPHRRMRANGLIHHRLGLHRLFGFVVAAPPIADKVHHHVFRELHAVVHRQLHGEQSRLRIVAVHVQDRRPNHLRHFRAVVGGTGILAPVGGEADLVVDDDVDGAADVEAGGSATSERSPSPRLGRRRRHRRGSGSAPPRSRRRCRAGDPGGRARTRQRPAPRFRGARD